VTIKLTGQHLPPLIRAFDAALREGAITVEEAQDFCHYTYNSLLEQRVRNREAARTRHTLEGNDGKAKRKA
jgi:hypothetical protein